MNAEHLEAHFPVEIICDHEAKTDQVVCRCAVVALPVCSSVGAAIKAWAEHTLNVWERGAHG